MVLLLNSGCNQYMLLHAGISQIKFITYNISVILAQAAMKEGIC